MAAETRVAPLGIVKWALRLLKVLEDHHTENILDPRHLLFICHSTGGAVVKAALGRNVDIAALCIGVAFFSTPHHGSNVLSEDQYSKSVRRTLGLKWEMSVGLRKEFRVRNPVIESLNRKFVVNIVGTKTYNFIEKYDTTIDIMTAQAVGGESREKIPVCVVDVRSGQLSTKETPVDDEETVYMNTDHMGAPLFAGEDAMHGRFLEELYSLVHDFSPEALNVHRSLYNDIMTNFRVEIHQFYSVKNENESEVVKILPAYSSLKEFLDQGPTKCLEAGGRGFSFDRIQSHHSIANARSQAMSSSYDVLPKLALTASNDTPSCNTTPGASIVSTPRVSLLVQPNFTEKILLVRRPPSIQQLSTVYSAASEPVNTHSKPRRAPTLVLPDPTSTRFRWIHIPATQAGWVPHVLTIVSQEKSDLSLHGKLLTDRLWFSQQTQSRGLSLGSRSVRSMAKVLMPSGAETRVEEGAARGSNATNTSSLQMAVYLPYLHWESCSAFQDRARIIMQRMNQGRVTPVCKEVADGSSMQNKIIVCIA